MVISSRILIQIVGALGGLVALAFLGVFIASRFRTPSLHRNWSEDQAKMPRVTFEGDKVQIQNLRHARYRSESDFDVVWETRKYDLNALESVWFLVEDIASFKGPAHTLVSFGFSDGRFLALSVELRKEVGESFSPLRGLLRQYELMYVIADEQDVIGLRANHRKDPVYLYPIKTPPERMRAMLVSMLQRAHKLGDLPEFYNTLTSSCTTNIVDHINELLPGRIPFSHKVLLPGFSDELAFDLGLIDTDLSFEEAKAHFHINDAAARHKASDDFSAGIRRRLQP